MNSVASVLKLLVLNVTIFAAAFGIRHNFMPQVMPIAWAEEPQALWAVELAFLLRSIENVALISAAILVLLAGARIIQRLVVCRQR